MHLSNRIISGPYMSTSLSWKKDLLGMRGIGGGPALRGPFPGPISAGFIIGPSNPPIPILIPIPPGPRSPSILAVICGVWLREIWPPSGLGLCARPCGPGGGKLVPYLLFSTCCMEGSLKPCGEDGPLSCTKPGPSNSLVML